MTYEEALEKVDDECRSCCGDGCKDCRTHYVKKALEKQIPKKPPDHDRTICPSCNSKAVYGNPYEYFCPHCGQAIDWSDDE